jgi:GTPase
VIIAGNKADLLEANTASNKFFARVHERFNDLYFAPFVAVSAKTGKNVFQTLDLAESILAKLDKKIQISSFNELVKRLLREKKMTTADHRVFSPKYISIESQRPFFIKFHCKSNLKLKPADEMFLKRRLNQELQLEGIPIYFKISASR